MRILVTGANGFIGRNLVRSLLARGHDVVACVRGPGRYLPEHPCLQSIQVDFSNATRLSDWKPHLEHIDIVINAVGLIKENRRQRFDVVHTEAPCRLFQACEQAGVKRVIQISALGADASAISTYHLTKRKADECLKKTNLDWIILSPSIVYGSDSASMNLFKAIASLPLIPIIDSGEQLIQPIHIDDFVDATMQLVSLDKQGTKQIAMPGPVAISMKELYQELNGWLGKSKAYFISIPYRLALAGAKLVGRISHTPVSVDTIRMLKQGNTADVKLFINEFGFTPKSVSEFLNLQSATQADRWYAGLYFLNPLLRLAIAFLWIFTGIVSAFIYPVEKSYQMLAQVGISMFWQPILLYTASILNILLGMATLLSYRLVLLGSIQLLVITIYTIVISLYLPGFWSHPFGPLSKNVPVVVLILIMMVLNSPRIKQ